MRRQQDLPEDFANGLASRGIRNDHELAVCIALGDLRAGDALDRGLDCGEILGSRLHQHTRDSCRVVDRSAGSRVGGPSPSEELSTVRAHAITARLTAQADR